MTKFETMDNMNTNFVALSNQELMDLEGGFLDPFTLGLIAGGGTVIVATGYSIWKSMK